MEQAIFLTEKQMDKQMNSLTMTAREIFDVTGYKQPARQKRVFETLGVPVHIRPDGTVSVCRQHYLESHTHTQVQGSAAGRRLLFHLGVYGQVRQASRTLSFVWQGVYSPCRQRFHAQSWLSYSFACPSAFQSEK